MYIQDVRIGMKVVLNFDKEEKCVYSQRAKDKGQPFLYVTGIVESRDGSTRNLYCLSDSIGFFNTGDYFYCRDFELYEEGKTTTDLDKVDKETKCGILINILYFSGMLITDKDREALNMLSPHALKVIADSLDYRYHDYKRFNK